MVVRYQYTRVLIQRMVSKKKVLLPSTFHALPRLTPADSTGAADIIAVVTLQPLMVIAWSALVAVLV